ncbi:MAG: tyrosine-type recombinase/integrase [Planctomycetota bacterium]|nr:tyrosine-type recombinase/integrase [Planctomycetota bacterium]
MPALAPRKIPSYRLHKRSGQAVVTLGGRDFYLGTHGSPESRRHYDRAIAEWMIGGRALPVAPADLTIAELLARFWQHVETFYRHADGSPTSEVKNFRRALRPLRHLYDDDRAAEFTPRKLKAVRHRMIEMGWCRSSINKNVGRIVLAIRWAVAQELVAPTIHQALEAVEPLKRGRSAAKELPPVKPVPMAHVNAIRPYLSRQLRALIDLQLLTGARSGELMPMRMKDLDTTGKIWLYRPDAHKTAHLGHARTIYIGPAAQEIIRGFMEGRATDRPLFSPADAIAEHFEARHAARKTPAGYGNRPGTNRVAKRTKAPGDVYNVVSYRRAIADACAKAWPAPEHLRPGKTPEGRRETPQEFRARLTPEQRAELTAWRRDHQWHPHQLRHNAATTLRKEFGLDTARIILGHRSAAITETYAEADHSKALDVIAKVG